jgi:hypothetical protein
MSGFGHLSQDEERWRARVEEMRERWAALFEWALRVMWAIEHVARWYAGAFEARWP